MDPEAILAGILAHWVDLRGGGSLPAKSQISPRKLGTVLPYVCLIDILPGPVPDYQYRLLGSHIRDFLDLNLKGLHHSALRSMEAGPEPNHVYFARCIESRTPQKWDSRFRKPNGTMKRMSAMAAPLSDDGSTVNSLLVGVVFHESAITADQPAPLQDKTSSLSSSDAK